MQKNIYGRNPSREQQLETLRVRASVLAEEVDAIEAEYLALIAQPEPKAGPTGHITDRAKELLKAGGHDSPFFTLPSGETQLRYDQIGIVVEPGHISVSFFRNNNELSILNIPVDGESAAIRLAGTVGYHGVSVAE